MLGNLWEAGKMQPRKKNEGCGYVTQSSEENAAASGISAYFTKEQIEQYRKLINQSCLNAPSNPNVGSCSMTQSGNLTSLFLNT